MASWHADLDGDDGADDRGIELDLSDLDASAVLLAHANANPTLATFGKGQLSTTLTALTTLDDDHLLTGVVGVIGTPRVEAKTGRLVVNLAFGGEDKYLVTPFTDIIGRPVAVVFYATDQRALESFAVDIIEPERALATSTRTNVARARLADDRYLREIARAVSADADGSEWDGWENYDARFDDA